MYVLLKYFNNCKRNKKEAEICTYMFVNGLISYKYKINCLSYLAIFASSSQKCAYVRISKYVVHCNRFTTDRHNTEPMGFCRNQWPQIKFFTWGIL